MNEQAPSKARVSGERFISAWIDLARLPGGMMTSSSIGNFGPVAAMTSCLITTDETVMQRWVESGKPVLEIQLADSAHEPRDVDGEVVRLRERESKVSGSYERSIVLRMDLEDLIQRAAQPPATEPCSDLPPLPPVDGYDKRVEGHYSAESMRAYALKARALGSSGAGGNRGTDPSLGDIGRNAGSKPAPGSTPPPATEPCVTPMLRSDFDAFMDHYRRFGKNDDWLYEKLCRNEQARTSQPPAGGSLAGCAQCSNVAPIANVIVSNGEFAGITMYAPGLPDGDHDVYPAASTQPPATEPSLTYRDLMKQAERDGVPVEQMIKGLMDKVEAQRRELARMNKERAAQPPVPALAGWLNREAPYQFLDLQHRPTSRGKWVPLYFGATSTKRAQCTCGDIMTLDTVHRTDGPCYAVDSSQGEGV